VALPVAARRHPGDWTRLVSRVFGVVLLAWFCAYHVVAVLQGSYALDFDLPLHLTDAVTVWPRSRSGAPERCVSS
jgi:uncharacterized membrane protein YwaF